MMLPTVDDQGFLDGTLLEGYVNEKNEYKVVRTQTPGTEISGFERWRWVSEQWVATNDYRNHVWYNPSNTAEEHRPQSFDDAPPTGWTYWAPGQNKVVGASEELAKAKEKKWSEIKRSRTTTEYGGFTWDGSTFDSDLASQQKIMGAAQLASLNPAYEVDWTLADNTVRHLNATQMLSVGTALGDHINTQYVHARTLRQQIADAQTTQELESIAW